MAREHLYLGFGLDGPYANGAILRTGVDVSVSTPFQRCDALGVAA